jgi:predicted phosphodiesterase
MRGAKTTIARAYRDEHGMEISHLKLARIMYAENKLTFKDVEDARSWLRYIEGKSGRESRRKVVNSKYFMEEQRPYNPYKLPESDAKDLPPFVVTGHKKALIISDVHLPYHDIDAITTCFDYAKEQQPDLVVLNGDIIDCFLLSKFVKDPKARKFKDELDQLKQFVAMVKETFNCRIIYKMGNHEMRYQHFLWEKAKELEGIEEFELNSIIQKRAPDVEIVSDKTIIMLNDLPLLHGHEFGKSIFSPVNVARGLHLRAKVSAIQGHSHKTSEHTETDLLGIIKTTWSCGCLCGLKPDYAPYNTWNHGFSIIDLDDNGVEWQVQNKRIYKNKVL